MENTKVYPVVTYIERCTGKVQSIYEGEYDAANCPIYRSFNADGDLGVPLWFTSEQAALDYIEKSHSETEREFFLIQEFTHTPNAILMNEAKIVLRFKSDLCLIMEDGKTERRQNCWADVRTFSVCDKEAAEDYVRRFNEDAKASFQAYCKA